MRRIIVGGFAVLATIIVALSAWDFLKPRNPVPALAPEANRATLILVEKAARRLTLFRKNEPIKTYKVSLGRNPIGHKQREWDSRTPEGRYSIDGKNSESHFHLALHISYPNAADQARATRNGDNAGGDIMVHGLPKGIGWLGDLHRLIDWTDGCVAVSNGEMDEIWALTAHGTPIELKP